MRSGTRFAAALGIQLKPARLPAGPLSLRDDGVGGKLKALFSGPAAIIWRREPDGLKRGAAIIGTVKACV